MGANALARIQIKTSRPETACLVHKRLVQRKLPPCSSLMLTAVNKRVAPFTESCRRGGREGAVIVNSSTRITPVLTSSERDCFDCGAIGFVRCAVSATLNL